MRLRALTAALFACLALGLPACGDDDKDEPANEDTTEQTTTSTTPQRDPATKLEMQRAVTAYNAGYREFRAGIRMTGGDLDRLKAEIADYRTVIFEFDEDLRAITFDDSLVPQVNAILESNRDLIAQLDGMAKAGTFDEVIAEFEAFQKDREPTIDAVNALLRRL
jgi:hypothetical protein